MSPWSSRDRRVPLPFLGLGFYLSVLALVAVGRSKPALQDTVLPILL